MAGLYTSTVYGPKSTVTKLDKIKDIGVYFDAKLDFKYHAWKKITKAYVYKRLATHPGRECCRSQSTTIRQPDRKSVV